jgi:hypothetical protein
VLTSRKGQSRVVLAPDIIDVDALVVLRLFPLQDLSSRMVIQSIAANVYDGCVQRDEDEADDNEG